VKAVEATPLGGLRSSNFASRGAELGRQARRKPRPLGRGSITWSAFFTEGRLEARLIRGNTVEIELLHLPVPHVSFEQSVMGYGKRALELVSGRPVSETQIIGIQRGKNRVLYSFSIR
jgi:hypothetical protein